MPATIVLKPVSATRMSALVLSTMPGPLPERICELAMLRPALPCRFTGPKTSAVWRYAAPPLIAIDVWTTELGQNEPPRPWSVPATTTTGVPVPPPTLRKLTLSKVTPEPPPVLFKTSEELVEVEYATQSERYSCWKPEPVKVIESEPPGVEISIACMETTPLPPE